MESVGRFKLLERLGAGALGELYKARDSGSERDVALCIVDPALAQDPASKDALIADARAAASLRHPNLACLLEVVELEDKVLLVQEFLEGERLADVMSADPWTPSRAVNVAVQAARALAAAAEGGATLGSFDPFSVILHTGDSVKVVDAGLARWTSRGRARRAAAGALEGAAGSETPEAAAAAPYVSPEQVLGAPGDSRADVFSLGVILYRLLAGRLPFDASGNVGTPSAAATLLQSLQASPAPPSRFNPSVSAALDAIVLRALAKSLDARYSGPSAFAADLRRVQEEIRATVSASPAPDVVPREESVPPILPAPAPVPLPPASRGLAVPSRPSPQTHGRRRDGHGRGLMWPALAAAVVVALVGSAAWYAFGSLHSPWRRAEVPPPKPVVIVLPFAVEGDEVSSYFGPGFAEDLAARLSEIPGVSVVGRGTIRALDARAEWQGRARKLGAAVALRGTIRPGKYAVHADVEMIDVGSAARAWSRHFQREPRQVSGLQAEIAAQVAQQLRLQTPTSNRWARAAVRQVEPAAYDLYLQGREAADRRDRSKAIGLYDEALQRDPQLVEARASLSYALYLEEYYAGSVREAASSGRALREAEAALAVDAELPAAHVAAALAAPTVTMAASALARALAFDPSNGEAWHYAGDLVSELDPPRSIAFYRASLALEPSIDANWRDLAAVQAATGDYVQAEQSLIKGEAFRPDRPWWKQMRARLALERQQPAAAADALLTDASVESSPIVWLMARVVPLTMAGRLVDARREASRMVERYPAFCEGRAVMAGVEIDGGVQQQGRQIAAGILADAARPDAGPAAMVCATLAAAATGDPAEAASWLSKVAADERALRLWTRQATFGVGLSFRRQWYPWTKVIGSQPMTVAGAQLEQSLARLRGEVERRLPAPK